MILEGTVSNVAAFGCFVDVGIHQDGLVHVTAMAKTFVKDPRSIAKPGDIVTVKVMAVDVPRKRISLSMRLDDPIEAEVPGTNVRPKPQAMRPQREERGASGSNPFAEAFAKAGLQGSARR